MKKLSHPPIQELGMDLLILTKWKLFLTIFEPIICFILFIVLAINGYFLLSLFSLVLMNYFTYGSTSHDLVHQNLRINKKLNNFILSILEILSLRSGHAYRLSHLNHHRIFPHDNDIEGKASHMTFFGSIIEGISFQYKIIVWALEKGKARDKKMIKLETFTVLLIIVGALCAAPFTLIPIFYVLLTIIGSWIIPLMTSYLVHTPKGENELMQTRLFRGKFFSIVSMEHLYHLEHHLYPMVPHKNWPKLAKRLDPYFKSMNLSPIEI